MTATPYFKIRINTLLPSTPLTFDLYVFVGGNYTLYLRAGDSIDLNKIQNLNKHDTGENFYILNEERPSYQSYIRTNMMSDKITIPVKAQILRESSMSLMEELFEHPDVNEALDNSRPIIKEFMHFMDSDPEAMGYLIGLSGHDFYTYNHSLDVAIYSMGLASILGFNKEELEEMGIGALFHDIGKRNVSLDILCKKGPLTDSEWAQMQKHPQYGLLILNDAPNISDNVKATCFEHHENFLGNGYPQQLPGPEIHPMARIVAITDTYDALTTQRSYNKPLSPHDALTMMKDKLAGKYDPDMLKAMHSVLFNLKKEAV